MKVFETGMGVYFLMVEYYLANFAGQEWELNHYSRMYDVYQILKSGY